MSSLGIRALRHIGKVSRSLPCSTSTIPKTVSKVPRLTRSDREASFLAALLVEGRDDWARLSPEDRKNAMRSTVSESVLKSRTNPQITTKDDLRQCYESGYRLAELLSEACEGHSGVDPSQVVFLSSPLERGLNTAKEAIRGFKACYRDKHGDIAASALNTTIYAVDELREHLAGSPESQRDSKSEIQERHPSVDVSALDEEYDYVHHEKGLSLGRSDDERSAMLDEAHTPTNASDRVGRLAARIRGIADSRRAQSSVQPVIVAFGHRGSLSELIEETHRDLDDKPKLLQYTDCVVSAYQSQEP